MGKHKPKGFLKYLLIVAVLAHVWLLQQPLPDALRMASRPSSDPVEIEKWKDLQIAQTHRVEKSVESKRKARFGAEFDQRVEKETRSPNTGVLSQASPPSSLSDRPGHSSTRAPDRDGLGDEAIPPLEPGGRRLKDLMGFSASPDKIPDDIVLGDETVLNSDSVSYASFLRRVTDEIYQPWVEGATQVVNNLQLEGRNLGANVYVTRLGVSLDDHGRVIAIQTLKSSGVQGLDEAPQRAFWNSDAFPNPPEQMRKADGTIRFVYEFHFEFKTSKFNIVPWSI